MSGERRARSDVGGVLANIVDGSHDVSRQLEGLPHALVGGVAVLVHGQVASAAQCQHIRAIAVGRLADPIGNVGPQALTQIREILADLLDL